jgi:restriction endonuclease S subunit
MKSNYKKLGQYIREINSRNFAGKEENLLGVSTNKIFIRSIANTVGTDFRKYKIVNYHQFTYVPDTSRRGDRIGIALLEDYQEALVSSAYSVFEITNQKELLPEYLMMWFRRPEFDRYARFKSHGSVREMFDWEEMCNVELPVPDVEKQKAIVKEYNTIVNRIKLNEELNRKLEETAQAIYRQWFVDFEFPCLPQDYRSSGQVNLNELNKVCTYKRVGGLPAPDGKSWFVYVLLCEDLSALNRNAASSAPEGNAGSFYKGITNDLYRRFYEHYSGQGAEWTKVHKPVKVIHYEQFNFQEEAAKREKELKTGFGRIWLKQEFEKLNSEKEGSPAHQSRLMQAGEMGYNEELGRELPVGWEIVPITEVIPVKDGTHDSPKPVPTGYSLVTSTHLNPYDVSLKDTYLISKEDYEEINRRSKVDKFDILFSMIGTVGTISFVLKEQVMFAIKNVGLFKTSTKRDFVEYFLFYLKSDSIKRYVETCLLGSTQNYITLTELRNIPLVIPRKCVLSTFNKIILPIVENLKNKSLEIELLCRLENTLLGKITKG